MKITTKKGDDGETSLLFGQRVAKSNSQIEAIGAIDELNAFLGLAKSNLKPAKLCSIITIIQKTLYILTTELACERGKIDKITRKIVATDVQKLEKVIDSIELKFNFPDTFVIPGKNFLSSAFDVARCVARRAERRVCEIKLEGMLVNEIIIHYLNRLSDLLFVLARYAEAVNIAKF